MTSKLNLSRFTYILSKTISTTKVNRHFKMTIKGYTLDVQCLRVFFQIQSHCCNDFLYIYTYICYVMQLRLVIENDI